MAPWDPLHRRIARTIERHRMFAPGDKVLAGVSGGADSVALLDVLFALAPVWRIHIAVAHLNHGLRPEAASREAALVKALAKQLGLVCHTHTLKPPGREGSLEEQLRLLRYGFFEQTAARFGYHKIATGHQADDNAEAVLLHLLRGGGIRGLGGIPPVRDGRIVRPLIDIRRADILAYLQRRNLEYLEDVSNSDPRFERNRIRHHLIPLLRRDYNPGIIAGLNRLARLCADENAWIDACIRPLAIGIVTVASTGEVDLDVHRLQDQPRPVQRRLIRAALEQWQGHLRRLTADHIEAVLDLLPRDKTGKGLDLPNNVRVQRYGTVVRFCRSTSRRGTIAAPCPADYAYRITSAERLPLCLRIPESGCCLRFTSISVPAADQMPSSDRRMALFDLDRVAFPLTVRNLRPGDRLQPFGMPGTQKLKDLLINLKIPRERRRLIPLLVSAGAVVWVAGLRRGRQACLTPDTKRVLKVEVATDPTKPLASPAGN